MKRFVLVILAVCTFLSCSDFGVSVASDSKPSSVGPEARFQEDGKWCTRIKNQHGGLEKMCCDEGTGVPVYAKACQFQVALGCSEENKDKGAKPNVCHMKTDDGASYSCTAPCTTCPVHWESGIEVLCPN